jgi:hypothetical protein
MGLGFAVEVVRVRRAVREADSDNVYKYRKNIVSIEARLRAPVCGKRMIIAQRRGSRMSILTLCKEDGHFGKSIIPKAQYIQYANQNSTGWQLVPSGSFPLKGAAYHCFSLDMAVSINLRRLNLIGLQRSQHVPYVPMYWDY